MGGEEYIILKLKTIILNVTLEPTVYSEINIFVITSILRLTVTKGS